MQSDNKEFYEKLSGKSLSEQETFEAKSNFVGFFELLYQIDKRNKENNEPKQSIFVNNCVKVDKS